MWLWALIPLSMTVIGNVGVWTACVVGIQIGSVNTSGGVPFVSDCADSKPQGPYLSQVLNTCGFIGFFVVLIRFLIVRRYGNYKKTNVASLIFGILFSSGVSLVANFSETSSYHLHIAASVAYFYGVMVFFWIQLFLMYRAEPSRNLRCTGPALAICCIIQTVMGNLVYILWLMGRGSDSAVCEFLFVSLVFLMFGFYIPEFSRIDSLQLRLHQQDLVDGDQSALTEKK